MKIVKSILSAHAKTIRSLKGLKGQLTSESDNLVKYKTEIQAKINDSLEEQRQAGAAIQYLSGLFEAIK